MNAVYIRMALYFLAPLFGMLPGVTYVSEAGQILIDIEAAALGIAGSAFVTGIVFKIWGKK